MVVRMLSDYPGASLQLAFADCVQEALQSFDAWQCDLQEPRQLLGFALQLSQEGDVACQ